MLQTVVGLIHFLVFLREGDGADDVHHLATRQRTRTIGQRDRTIVVSIEHRRDAVAHELEGANGAASLGYQRTSTLIVHLYMGTEGDHVELTIHRGHDDTPGSRLHDGIAIDELRVVEPRTELEPRGRVGELFLVEAVVPTVVLVEGREHVPVVERDGVDVRRHEVDEGRHGPAVLTDGAAHHAGVDIVVVGIL